MFEEEDLGPACRALLRSCRAMRDSVEATCSMANSGLSGETGLACIAHLTRAMAFTGCITGFSIGKGSEAQAAGMHRHACFRRSCSVTMARTNGCRQAAIKAEVHFRQARRGDEAPLVGLVIAAESPNVVERARLEPQKMI